MTLDRVQCNEPYFVLLGDSWAVGEWRLDKNAHAYHSGLGLGSFLSQEGICLDLSQGGGNNLKSLQRLENFLSYTNLPESTRYIWIVSNPMFDCLTAEEFYDKQDNLTSRTEKLLDNVFRKANKIARKYKIKLNLVGGAVDIEQSINYSNLQVIVPSWCQMMFSDFPVSLCSPHINYWKDLSPIISTQHKEEWLDITDLMDAKLHFFKKHFINDNCHPLSEHHLILKNKIIKLLNEQ